jgi:hypothetical protein
MINTNLIVVEFSVKQNCFHKHSLIRMLSKNVENCLFGKETDFVPIGIFETEEKADIFILTKRKFFEKQTSEVF